MENGQTCSCFNGTQDDGNYSAPVPVIGLYIAGATLVCLLLIVGDLVHAFRSRMLWVPCRFFPINSFTLTVVGVVTKIPVDLTTPMPDGQLAKLCGTVLLFIFMVLFLPSFGNVKASERLPNLASLTLIVITVIINICLQIGTGLIFEFVVEHVVIFALMLVTLGMMWSSNSDVDDWFENMIGSSKVFLKERQSSGEGTIDFDIKFCPVNCQMNAPELLRCKLAHYPTMGILCATCFIVLSEATFRALHRKTSMFFGQSVSDYKWSMWVVVGTQIITILVGCVSIGLKSLFLASRMKPFAFADEYITFTSYQHLRSFMPFFQSYYFPKILSRLYIPEIFQALQVLLSFSQFIINSGMEWTDQVLIFLVVQIGNILGILKNRNVEEIERIGRHLPSVHLIPMKDESFNVWLQMQSIENTELLIEKERLRNPRSSHLIQLLSGYPHLRTSLMQQLDSVPTTDEFLLFVLLVRLTDSLLPSDRTTSLVGTFEEVFDILYFIGENPVTKQPFGHDFMMRTAREFWMCRKISNHYLQRRHVKNMKKWSQKFNYDAGRILRSLGTEGTSVMVGMTSIVNILDIQENEPSDVLYERIEELFVCLLHRFLNRLPNIIYKYIVESPNQDFLTRAVMCLKFLCRLNLIDANVRWSETNIIRFITRETTGVPIQVDTVADVHEGIALHNIIGVASDEQGSQTETLPDDYSSEILIRIAACLSSLIVASHLTIGVPIEEQGNQTIISMETLDSSHSTRIIAHIAARIGCLIIASPLPTTGVAGEERGSETLETFLTNDYNNKIVVRVAAGIAALILDSHLTIGVAGEEQGSQTFITRETLTDDYNRKIVVNIATGVAACIAAGIIASPPTVGVASEEQGSQTFITGETSTDGYRREIDARVAARVAALIIALPPTIGVAGEEQGSQTFTTRETLTAENLLHVLLIALLSNIYSNGVAGEGQGTQTSIANDGADQN